MGSSGQDIKVDHELVQRIAKLANLKLDPAEIEHYRVHLDKILVFMNDLKKFTPPSDLPKESDRPQEREDVVRASFPAETALSQNPEGRSGWFFQVPKIIDS